MDLLEGAAAFTVVMIVLSTVVSGIVEVILRATATRPAVLLRAVKTFADEKLAKLVAEKLGGEAKIDAKMKGVVNALVLNPLAMTKAGGATGDAEAPIEGWWQTSNRVVDTLTTYAFLQRLAGTELGKELASKGAKELEPILTDLTRTYERYVAASNEVFRKNANTLGAAVAIFLAFFANIDASRVFTFLMETPDARSALIDSAEEAAVANEAAVTKLNTMISRLEAGSTDQAAFTDDAALRDAVAGLRNDLRPLLEQAALPIGWEYYPYCVKAQVNDKAKPGCGGGFWPSLLWAPNVLLAGLLVSLGGPFWYKVFTSLSGLLQLARNLTGGGRHETVQKDAADLPESAKAIEKTSLSNQFKIAAGMPPEAEVGREAVAPQGT